MKNMRPSNSDSSDSSDTTAEFEVLLPIKARHRSLGPSRKQSTGSSSQPFSPTSTSPPLDTATPGPSGRSGLPASRSLQHITSRSRSPQQMTRLACTIRYLWHLLRQHERTENLNKGLVRFWAIRYGTLLDQTNGCNLNLSSDHQRQTPNLSNSTSEDLRSLTVEPPSDDESAEMNSDPLPSEEQDRQSLDNPSSSCEIETSLKEKSDTDDEKSHFFELETSNSSKKVTEEVNQLITSLGQIHIQDEEQSDDSLIFDLPEPVASTSKDTHSSDPTSSQLRMQRKQRRRIRAEKCKRGVICSAVRIVVPTGKVGRIVGKGGRQIKVIEKKTGTNITIENRKSNKPATIITVRGTNEAIEAAEQEIHDLIRNYKQSDIGEL